MFTPIVNLRLLTLDKGTLGLTGLHSAFQCTMTSSEPQDCLKETQSSATEAGRLDSEVGQAWRL